MIDLSKFESISPYSDDEAVEALRKVADHPALVGVSKVFFPNQTPDYLSTILKKVKGVDDFQVKVMTKVIDWVLDNTTAGFSYNGIENLQQSKGKFLAMSNHRDIILDPAVTQLVLYKNGFPMTEIAVGDNLISSKFIEYLIRSNRMIKVVRGISARELYLSSQLLSEYIRTKITTNDSSIWLAQRQGRTKNGYDTTEQGLLKMLDMSGTNDFKTNFEELNIIPMSISYEYEPCDIYKAREILISQTEKYVKQKDEDMNSIITGIKQWKGHVHLHIGKALTSEEVSLAAECDKNDRYQWIRNAVDERVIEGYRLWKTHYISYDLVYGGNKYAENYTEIEKQEFIEYVEKQLDTVEKELDRDKLKEIFLKIYSNSILAKEEFKKL